MRPSGLQSGLQALGKALRNTVTVKTQHTAGGQRPGQIGLGGGHAGLTLAHQGDFGAGKLLLALLEKAAVHPQGAAGLRNGQRGGFACKAAEPCAGSVVGGQKFAAVGIGAGDQIGGNAVLCHGRAQSGNTVIGCIGHI